MGDGGDEGHRRSGEVRLGKTKNTGETLQDIEDRKHEDNRIKRHYRKETRQGRSLRAVTGEMRNTVDTKLLEKPTAGDYEVYILS